MTIENQYDRCLAINRARFGDTGTPISGSQFYRGYCQICAAPIRLTANAIKAHVAGTCSNCIAQRHPGQGTQSGWMEEPGSGQD